METLHAPNIPTAAAWAGQEFTAALSGTTEKSHKDLFDIQSDALHGAIGGLTLPMTEFDLLLGLKLKQTFCHIIAPYVMAFSPPTGAGKPHPVGCFFG